MHLFNSFPRAVLTALLVASTVVPTLAVPTSTPPKQGQVTPPKDETSPQAPGAPKKASGGWQPPTDVLDIIIKWMQKKPNDISRAVRLDGGWEWWFQTELSIAIQEHLDIPAGEKSSDAKREVKIYNVKNGAVDIHIGETVSPTGIDQVFEIKCETEKNVGSLSSLVTQDMNKLKEDNVKSTSQGATKYVVAMTISDKGAAAMKALKLTQHKSGQALKGGGELALWYLDVTEAPEFKIGGDSSSEVESSSSEEEESSSDDDNTKPAAAGGKAALTDRTKQQQKPASGQNIAAKKGATGTGAAGTKKNAGTGTGTSKAKRSETLEVSAA